MDNLSLIYENSLHNRIRRDVLQEFIYQKTNNKHQKAEYMIEHVLNVSELEYLTEQGFLKKIGQGVKNIAKKAAPYAAAGLMAAGAARGDTPIDQQIDHLYSQNQNQNRQQEITANLLYRQQDYLQDILTKCYELTTKLEKATGTSSINPTNPLIIVHKKSITKLQVVSYYMTMITNAMENENELRSVENKLYGTKKAEINVSVRRLHGFLKSFIDSFDFNDLKKTVGLISGKATSLEDEMIKIKKIAEDITGEKFGQPSGSHDYDYKTYK
jgi:hypothetical protein